MAVAKRGNAAKKENMADGEDEPEFEDQYLSESNKFALYKDLNAAKETEGLEKLLQKYNFSPNYLSQQQQEQQQQQQQSVILF